jgi:P4 family phage/plasmid primase-like protien
MAKVESPALKLYEAGYTDLVCVAPPGVKVSKNSGLKENDLGKRPAKRGSHGWYGYGWQTDEPSVEDLRRWQEWNANLGLRGTRFPALDIDSKDPMLTKVVKKIALEELGPAPSRIGKEPKELLVYRTDEPFSRVAVEIKRGGETHLVEFLGHGRQYLVYGKHPTGVHYRWPESPLWEVAQDTLTPITGEDVERFLAVLEERLSTVGLEVQRVGRASAVNKASVAQESLVAPSVEALAAVVDAVPNDANFSDRDDYITFGCAVKAAAGEDEEDGYLIFSTWAAKWEDGENDPETVRADWRRMHPPFRVGYNWLTEQADNFNDAIYEFEADPTAVPPPVVERDPNVPVPVDCTDDWLAEKIEPEIENLLRFDYPNDRWHVWDGTRWAHDDRGQHNLLVLYALRRLAKSLRAFTAGLGGKEAQRWNTTLNKLGNVGTLRAVVALLESRLAVGTDAFDCEGMQLNTPAGIIDLETGTLLEHDASAMHSKSTTVAPGGTSSPVWEKFIQEVTGGDEALARFMQKQAGYALTGVRREQTLNFVWGPGSNGKSVFVDALMGVMGDYAATAPMDTFASTKGDKHPTDLAGLMGARLVTATETQAGRSWDEQRIKAITGGDRMRARFMRQDFVEFTPQFKLILVGNHEPLIDSVDDAMRRRIHIVPFTFRPAKPNLRLPEELKAEYPAILRWMLEGCLMWQTEGLEPPECVLLRTQEYFEGEDMPRQWLQECCDMSPESTMSSVDAYRSWQIWCGQAGEPAGTQREFVKSLRPLEPEFGFSKAKVGPSTKRQHGWKGISLINNPNDIRGDLT